MPKIKTTLHRPATTLSIRAGFKPMMAMAMAMAGAEHMSTRFW